jgi:hypothetical protein
MDTYIAKISKFDSKMGESTNRTEPCSPLFGNSKRNVFKGSNRNVFKSSFDGSKRDVLKISQ